MKKIIYLLIFIVLCVSMAGCNRSKYTIYEMKINNDIVEKDLMHEYLLNNDDFNYEAILKNTPDLMDRLYNVTPKDLKHKCSIYRFSYENCGGLGGETFLLYDDEVYSIGSAFGGYGVTEFAYVNTNQQNMLYYIYSCGSGIHRSGVGAFDFKTKTMSLFTGNPTNNIDELPFAGAEDISFYTSDDGYLGICKAKISWKSSDTFEVDIVDGESVLYFIKAVDFIPIDK